MCVLGATVAKEIFGSAYDAYDGTVYIDGRPYIVSGVLSEMGTVASGISPDTAIYVPYETGIKYITGTSISPTITVIAEDVNQVDTVMTDVESALKESYPNTTFTISDAGSKMEAASASNETLTLLLISMAVIVFIVGGIGIMNVLFVSIKERTNEIGAGGAGGSWNYAIRAAVQRESVPVGTGCGIVAVVWCPHRKYLRLLSGV